MVVKVAADLWGEANALAQLQHPSIVPVYSVHHHEPFQAVCMPYQGWTTLQDLLKFVQTQASLPTSGLALAKVIKQPPAEVFNCQTGDNGGRLAEPSDSGYLGRLAADQCCAAQFAGLSYVEAIVWIGVQLADGLAHAHEHGIVHHDLKPANVLLSDEGRPMLLDFNAAEDTKRRPDGVVAWVAGTLPYMAPEQLQAFQGNIVPIDLRADLYSFGVIMFELLSGRYPFGESDCCVNVFESILADRGVVPPALRKWNQAVSPALEAIVQRCLERDPARRYQSARELQEDLQRQHSHRPLRHVAEPSRQERMHKWLRRHPWALMTVCAAIFLLALGLHSVVREHQLEVMKGHEDARITEEQAHARALMSFEQFQTNFKAARFILYTCANEPDQLAGGVSLGTRLADCYSVLEGPAWLQNPLVSSLPAGEQEQLKDGMGELLLLLARAISLQHSDQPETQRRFLESALLMNERAESCSPRAAASPALWRQRGDLNASLGRDAEASSCREKSKTLPLVTAADHYWLASDYVAGGRLREALPLLLKATRLEPANFWAWFVLANCYERLGMDSKAEFSYGTCVALRPSNPWAYFNRGLALLRQLDYRAACADFDTVIGMRPDLADAYLNRALAHQGLEQYAQAEGDLTEALQRGGATRLYFLRARLREKQGDKEGAARDYEEGLRRPPQDEKSWLARGYYLLMREPEAALANFEQALRLNPRSADALQNKRNGAGGEIGPQRGALEVLNKSLAFYPDSVKARGGRGVLYARLGKRELAHQDAEEALLRDTSPLRLYQVACIYALTSTQQPEDRCVRCSCCLRPYARVMDSICSRPMPTSIHFVLATSSAVWWKRRKRSGRGPRHPKSPLKKGSDPLEAN